LNVKKAAATMKSPKACSTGLNINWNRIRPIITGWDENPKLA